MYALFFVVVVSSVKINFGKKCPVIKIEGGAVAEMKSRKKDNGRVL